MRFCDKQTVAIYQCSISANLHNRCAPDDTPCADDADCALKCCGTTTIVDAGGQRRCA